MDIKYVIGIAPLLLEDMVVKIWETQSDEPGAEVYTRVIPERNNMGVPTPGAGHQVPYVFEQAGFDLLTHTIRLYTNGGIKLQEYTEEATVNSINVFDPIRFKIGDGQPGTPNPGDNSYQNVALEGLGDNDYFVHRNNYGYLFPNRHYETTPLDGAWNLLEDDVFGENEEFTIFKKSGVITNVVNDSVVGKWVKDVQDVAADRVYSAADLRKLLRFVGTCKYTFPVDAGIPKGYAFVFQHFGAGAANSKGTVEFLNAPLLWNNVTKNSIDLPLYTEGCFEYDGVNWNVIYLSDSRWVNAGSVVPGDVLGVGELHVGNVNRAAWLWTITHNLGIAGDYYAFVSVRGTATTAAADTNICVSWRHHASDKANSFHVITREPENVSSLNDITLCWVLFKN
jgi:hypothetical protein